MPTHPPLEIYLARHGETAWSISGQHTGTTDIPLTENGEKAAKALGGRLAGVTFDHVFTSPRIRAVRTAELAGFGGRAEVEPDLQEWNYGSFEGLTTDQIHQKAPGWNIFRDGVADGESVAEAGARADRLLAKVRGLGGRILMVSHGHFTRVVAVRWLGLPVEDGRLFLLATAALSILGSDHGAEEPAIKLWNDTSHVKS